ncbi:unnamed protein product [Dovyalis caffra]|uniref:Peptide deformylase n=1 Tax=Dovyalis caffra TaxID=77055 RepID=A0AAV1SUT0_9ROSI|nr:unnamed protein product [Dovyalis caffra]
MPDIVKAGDPVLHEPAREVDQKEIRSERIQKIIDDMVKAMRMSPGVGLAAPQIGIPLRIIVLEDTAEYIGYAPKDETKAQDRRPFDLLVIVNPKLKKKSNRTAFFFEGCLSLYFGSMMDIFAKSGYVLTPIHHKREGGNKRIDITTGRMRHYKRAYEEQGNAGGVAQGLKGAKGKSLAGFALLVDGFRAIVERNLDVEVTGLSRDGQLIKVDASGWQARILQHECDHLEGTLYVDKMVPRTFRTVENLDLPLAEGCPKLGSR